MQREKVMRPVRQRKISPAQPATRTHRAAWKVELAADSQPRLADRALPNADRPPKLVSVCRLIAAKVMARATQQLPHPVPPKLAGAAIGPAAAGFLFASSETVSSIARSIGTRSVPLFLSTQA